MPSGAIKHLIFTDQWLMNSDSRYCIPTDNARPLLGCNTGTGNSAVSQPRVPRVRVRFRDSGPEAVPQPVTAVSRVFTVLSCYLYYFYFKLIFLVFLIIFFR
jgi:hypothetical protein